MSFVPKFEGTRFYKSVARVSCVDKDSRSWLENVVDRLAAKLKIQLFVCEEIQYFFPFAKDLSWETIERLLKKANPCLTNVVFSIKNRKTAENGVHYLLGVRPQDKPALANKGTKFNFGMGKAYIRESIQKGKNVNSGMKPDDPAVSQSEFESDLDKALI